MTEKCGKLACFGALAFIAFLGGCASDDVVVSPVTPADNQVVNNPNPETSSIAGADPSDAPVRGVASADAPSANLDAIPVINPMVNPAAAPAVNPAANPAASPVVNPAFKPAANPAVAVNPAANPAANPSVRPVVFANVPAVQAVSSQVSPSSDSLRSTSLNVFGEVNGQQPSGGQPTNESGMQQHTFIDDGYDSDVSVDPTGKWMVFTSTRHSDHPNIYMQRSDGVSVIQLTNDLADYAYPVFSPDGKTIAFSSTRGGNWDLYTMDTDGRNVVQLTNGPGQHVHPSYSPDGSRLVYSSLGSKSQQWELWTIDVNTNEKRMIGFGLFPSWSPDKSADRIAFQRARQRGSRWFSLWTLELVNGEAHRVSEVAVSTNAAIVAPSWSPDGRKIAFATVTDPGRAGSRPAPGQQDIWTINADGTGRDRLTDGVGLNLTPCWASDGGIYFVSDRSGVECVWSLNGNSDMNAAPKVADKPHGHDTPPINPVGDASN